MARSFRIAWFVAAAATVMAVLGAGPAAAQFVNPFEALFGSPPRPPSNVPAGRQPPQAPVAQPPGYPQYPDQQYPPPYPGQPYPPEARQTPPDAGVQSQPLPPPEGAAAAIDPSAHGPGGVPVPGALPGQPLPANVPPDDETVTEPPPQKIANKAAVFSGLDKITGRITSFDAAIGETVQFGALQVTLRACYTRPPTETPNTDAFLEVDEVTLQGEVKRIFMGWMFAASPGLHAVEHPIYDVWLTDCKNPVVAASAPPESAPPVTQPVRPPAATRRGAAPGARH